MLDGSELKGKMNSLKSYREQILISRTELARKTGLSVQTIERIEKGEGCRLKTKRKIILALDLEISEKDKIFGSED
jgi:DNA-binding XRE family transcriptional regulator